MGACRHERNSLLSETPQTWHHGLVAKWWSEFNTDGPEIDYYRQFIEDGGEAALDVACGTGRLLLPWLRAGLDVDGCDVSADMVALCREQAERDGLSPTLFVQAMHELDPPRRYRTIVVCGAFGLGSTRAQDLEALNRFHAHLEPGGRLLLDNEVPYSGAQQWRRWLKEVRRELPEPWPPSGDRQRGADGAEYALRARALEFDPLDQSVTLEMRAERWLDGDHTEEDHTLTMRHYFRNELLLMLAEAGFIDVEVRGDHTDAEATGDHDTLVFSARKPRAAP
jgi:SAM-dependent methyltransferase